MRLFLILLLIIFFLLLKNYVISKFPQVKEDYTESKNNIDYTYLITNRNHVYRSYSLDNIENFDSIVLGTNNIFSDLFNKETQNNIYLDNNIDLICGTYNYISFNNYIYLLSKNKFSFNKNKYNDIGLKKTEYITENSNSFCKNYKFTDTDINEKNLTLYIKYNNKNRCNTELNYIFLLIFEKIHKDHNDYSIYITKYDGSILYEEVTGTPLMDQENTPNLSSIGDFFRGLRNSNNTPNSDQIASQSNENESIIVISSDNESVKLDNAGNDFGTYEYGEGDKYIGEVINGKPHGEGTYLYANGDKYVGEFVNDKRHGQGTYTWASGDKYVGGYFNDQRQGSGTFTYADGDQYIGKFIDGKFVD